MNEISDELIAKAAKEPLDVDVSDYSDEFVAGFLRGQVNAFHYLNWLDEGPSA